MMQPARPHDDPSVATRYSALLDCFDRWKTIWWLPVVVVLVAALLARFIAVGIPPLLDEQFWLSWTGKVGGPGVPWGQYFAWKGFAEADLWGPLTALIFRISHLLTGGYAPLLRLEGIAIHAGSAFLLFMVLRRVWSDFWFPLIAAVLFCFFPLNAEAVSWFGGRGAQLSGSFFIAAVWAYQHARGLNILPADPADSPAPDGLNWKWLIGSLLLFICSLLSSAISFSACFFFAYYELLLWYNHRHANNKIQLSPALIASLLFIVAAVAILAGMDSLLRLVSLSAPQLTFAAAYKTLRALVFPINEAIWHGYARQFRIMYFLLIPYCILFLMAIKISGRFGQRILFLCGWLAIMLLPEIGHIATDADMFGSRLLYLAAMPFCAIIAMLFFSGTVVFRSRPLIAAAVTAVGLLILSSVYLAHGWNQDAAYRNGGRVLHNVQKSIAVVQAKTNSAHLLVRDVPPYVAVSPAFSTFGLVAFDAPSGLLAARYVSAGRLKDELNGGKYLDVTLQWEPETHQLRPLDLAFSPGQALPKMNASEIASHFMPSLEYYKSDRLDVAADELILDSNSENGPVVRLDLGGVGPLSGDFLYLDAQIDGPPSARKPFVEMYWQTPLHLNYDERDRMVSAPAFIGDGRVHRYLLPLRTIGFTTSGPINSITIGFPASARVKLKSMGLLPKIGLTPAFDVDRSAAGAAEIASYSPPFKNYPIWPELGLFVLPVGAGSIPVTYSIDNIANAAGITVEVSMPFKDFPNPNGTEYSGVGFKTTTFMAGEPAVVSVTDLPNPGVYALRAVAVDKEHHPISTFSDAVYVLVRTKNRLPQEN